MWADTSHDRIHTCESQDDELLNGRHPDTQHEPIGGEQGEAVFEQHKPVPGGHLCDKTLARPPFAIGVVYDTYDSEKAPCHKTAQRKTLATVQGRPRSS